MKKKITIFAAAAAAAAAAICCFWASAKIWTIFWCVAGSVCLVLTAGYGLSFEPINKKYVFFFKLIFLYLRLFIPLRGLILFNVNILSSEFAQHHIFL
jgi:hypothetical protein